MIHRSFRARRAGWHAKEVKQGPWAGRDMAFLRGKTLGILGTGHIGMEMARLGRAIGMNVVAWTLHPSSERSKELGIPFLSLDDLLRTADALSIHVRLTEETRGLIG